MAKALKSVCFFLLWNEGIHDQSGVGYTAVATGSIIEIYAELAMLISYEDHQTLVVNIDHAVHSTYC